MRHRSYPCQRQQQQHRQLSQIVIVEARPLSTTAFSASWRQPSHYQNFRHNIHHALSIREDERGEEMEVNSHENTMLLLDTMMMDSTQNNAVPAEECEVDSDGYYNDDGMMEQRNPSPPPPPPFESTSPMMTSSESSSSEFSNNKGVEEMNYSGDLNIKSGSGNSSGGNTKEQRPSNRRMQVFAYLSKPGEYVMVNVFITL